MHERDHRLSNVLFIMIVSAGLQQLLYNIPAQQ